MKSTLLFIIIFNVTLGIARSQYAAEAFRFSEINQFGTARFQALGGNQTALGGDATSIFGNPAGLGFYTQSEATLSPGFSLNQTNTSYIGQNAAARQNLPALEQASVVIKNSAAWEDPAWKSSTAVAYSRQKSYAGQFDYRGTNHHNAFADYLVGSVNELNISPEELNADFDSKEGQAYSLAGAYYQLFLINPISENSTQYDRFDRQSVTEQAGDFRSEGSNSQVTIAFGASKNDKLYLGANIGFSILYYTYHHTLNEAYPDGKIYESTRYYENLDVSGSGVNATIGAIYKIKNDFQVGVTLSTPTFSRVSETFRQIGSVVTRPNDIGVDPELSTIPVAPNDFEYNITGPMRASAGATYFFGNFGFLTGSVEFAGYRGMSVGTANDSTPSANEDFRELYKTEISETYRNTVNGRLGVEYRAGFFRGRLGAAFCGDPYARDFDDVNRSKLFFSAGLGIRKNRFFADISGTFTSYETTFTPYVVNDGNGINSALIKNRMFNSVLTLGLLF